MTITHRRIQYCSILKDITVTPLVARSSLLHERPGAVKPPDLIKKLHHVGDLDKTPAILVSLAFFHFSCVLIFSETTIKGLKTFRSVNLKPNIITMTPTIVVEVFIVSCR
ncbi:hypothetical protein MTR67_010165 [Solanum verrucosum]|uniref:Uncharacterized protein n=1 Tax=Solanum verrucosum TaxID=315347 RepID=A0AAF0TKT6_SOLVR|nr:hypothetical protein MTR67_010165 [Solanum verrucosum]